jgi:hypothetical protein
MFQTRPQIHRAQIHRAQIHRAHLVQTHGRCKSKLEKVIESLSATVEKLKCENSDLSKISSISIDERRLVDARYHKLVSRFTINVESTRVLTIEYLKLRVESTKKHRENLLSLREAPSSEPSSRKWYERLSSGRRRN